ncbi:hypothetical protein HC026_10870 [Lactobacillus sp. LC28-10]|uniref:Uncharacterized protein n=1 Tax=Secundilactobacillus angelensis TaxID=2722706 RepID=A0ABX1KZN0_9LACO|nr:hypothetical protein [Secundilactobacillus angelensis]MCH5463361.1 hypothetical protein [Secundilactobacillus angelensis]NLR19394.1 hypothetical protein [Secundilactobacillus angelensis]
MKLFKNLLIGIALGAAMVFGIGQLSQAPTASASSWHRGTPKVLRGKYQGKLPKGSALGFGPISIIAANHTIDQSSGMPQIYTKNVKYKKYGHYYRIIGHAVKSGMFRGGKMDTMYYKKGHSLKEQPTSEYISHHHSFKWIGKGDILHKK